MKCNLARYKHEVTQGTSALDVCNVRYAVITNYTSINGTLALTALNDEEWRVVA